MLVWLKDQVIEADKALVSTQDRGFTLGDGLYETIRVKQGAPRHLDRHLARLTAGGEVLALPVDLALARKGVMALCDATGMAEGVLRLTLSRGIGARGLVPPADPKPSLVIAASPLPPMPEDIDAIVATITRRNEYSPLSRIKSLNMLDNVMARAEAENVGAGEALLLNTKGRPVEAATANIFVKIGADLVTPPVSEGVLPGISRALVMESLDVVERPMTLDELKDASEIVLTNSLSVRRIVRLDGVTVGDGSGMDTQRIREVLTP